MFKTNPAAYLSSLEKFISVGNSQNEVHASPHIYTNLDHAEYDKFEATTSQWTVGESLAAADRKYRRREISLDERDTITATIMEKTVALVDGGKLAIIYAKQDLVSPSWRLITERHLSADDALHLFSAIVGLCDVFISADAYLLDAASKVGFDCYNIEDSAEFRRLIVNLRLE